MAISNIVLEALKIVIEIIKNLKIDYCLFGGLAMQAYKRIRATMDIDLMIAINKNETSNLILKLETEGIRFDKKKGIIKIGDFNFLRFIYTDKALGLEIFIDIVTAETDFQKEILQRKQRIRLFNTDINIASCEDIVLLKTVAGRALDKVDAQELIKENFDGLDKIYLKKWSEELGVRRQVELMLRRSNQS